MSDGPMTPEFSSIDSMRQLGAVPGQEIPKVPGATDMLSESSKQMMAEHQKPWQEQSKNIPESAIAGHEVVNLKGGDEDDLKKEMDEFFARAEMEGRNEDYAKNDRVHERLTKATKPKDLEPVVKLLRDSENVSFAETLDRYSLGRWQMQMLGNWRAYELSGNDLVEQGVVEGGVVNSDGYLSPEGVIRFNGYTLRVESGMKDQKIITPKERYKTDKEGNKYYIDEITKTRVDGVDKWEEVEYRKTPVEKYYFGKDNERLALSKANEALMKFSITSRGLNEQSQVFYNNRAALEEMVKLFYLRDITFTNEQIGWFFTAPEIGTITPDNLENKQLGDKRDKAMRLLYLIGNCETKEKMEEHLNGTFNLEQILDTETVERTLALMKKMGVPGKNFATDLSPAELAEAKFGECVKFLIGKDVKVTKDAFDQKHYEVGGWLTKDQRDPSKKIGDPNQAEDSLINKNTKRGVDAVKFESNSPDDPKTPGLNVRGFLTFAGNPYTRGEKDKIYAYKDRISLIVGDKGVVNEADKMFWVWGLRDELGLEIYVDKNNIPSGDILQKAFNEFTPAQRKEWCDTRLKYFSLNGEPTASDLSKIFYPDFYRLKDHLKDRITGPLVSTGEYGRMSQCLTGLCRVDIEGGKTRSVTERWMGAKKLDATDFETEVAYDLGDISWEQISTPKGIMDELTEEINSLEPTDWEKVKLPKGLKDELASGVSQVMKKVFSPDSGAVGDNAMGFYWCMQFLVGDGNPAKRPWAFATAPVDSRTMASTDAFTGKIKFADITTGANGAWGKWRDLERRARVAGVDAGDLLKKEGKEKIRRTLRGWYKGVQSSPEYADWETQKTAYWDYKQNKEVMTNLRRRVEGFKGNPGLAVKYGFLDESELSEKPKWFTWLPKGSGL